MANTGVFPEVPQWIKDLPYPQALPEGQEQFKSLVTTLTGITRLKMMEPFNDADILRAIASAPEDNFFHCIRSRGQEAERPDFEFAAGMCLDPMPLARNVFWFGPKVPVDVTSIIGEPDSLELLEQFNHMERKMLADDLVHGFVEKIRQMAQDLLHHITEISAPIMSEMCRQMEIASISKVSLSDCIDITGLEKIMRNMYSRAFFGGNLQFAHIRIMGPPPKECRTIEKEGSDDLPEQLSEESAKPHSDIV